MIIMALDHVRDLIHIHSITQSPTDLATTLRFCFSLDGLPTCVHQFLYFLQAPRLIYMVQRMRPSQATGDF